VKTAGAPDGLPPRIKAIAESVDPKLFPNIWLLRSGFKENTSGLEKIAMIASLLGMVAVSLAGVGIVGLVAYTVSQRTKEIAIRVALGARPAHVISIVLRQFLVPVLAGVVIGTAATAAISQTLRKVLYGVSNLDPMGYAAGIGTLVAIAVLAALVPARRALRVDPLRALHEE
jgi:ABC-type antimicrobial peptide transport system permease subunit